jgi:hypothetical protein
MESCPKLYLAIHAFTDHFQELSKMTTSSRMLMAILAFVIHWMSMAPLAAQLPVPNLSTIFPLGGQQGTSVELTITGTNLDEAEKLIFSHPGITAQPKQLPADDFRPQPLAVPNQFVVNIGKDVPPGFYEIRHVGRYGASNPRVFAVSNVQEVLDKGDINQREKAQEVSTGVVVNGRTENNNYDYYALQLKAGDRVLIECQAQRLDSRANGTLVLLDPSGQEVARALDTIGADPVLDFTAKQEGRHVVVMYDFVFNGGPEYGYRLAITSQPFIDFVFPPSATVGSNSSFTLYGRNLPGSQIAEGVRLGNTSLQKLAVNISIPSDEKTHTSPAVAGVNYLRSMLVESVEYKWTDGNLSSNSVAIGVARAPVVAEQEPNNKGSEAQKITLPCEYVGQFFPQRDEDWLQFDAKKGERYDLQLLAHRLGRTCDPVLLIQRIRKNDKGEEQIEELAQADDPADRTTRIGGEFDMSTDDPSYRLNVPEDATYRVMIRDQFGDGRADPRFVYRLSILPPQPDFRVAVFPDLPSAAKQNNQISIDTFNLPRGGTAILNVSVVRSEFDGEIELSVENLPTGVTCGGAILGGNVDRGLLVFAAEENAAAWSGAIRVVAKAQVNGQTVVRVAQAGTTVWGSQNKDQDPPRYRSMRDLVLSVTHKEASPVLIKAGDGNVIEMALGGKVELPVHVKRYAALKDPLKVSLFGFVKDAKGKEMSLDNSKTEDKYEFELSQQTLKPGTYTFCLRGDSKVAYAKSPELIAATEAEQKQLMESIQKLQERQKAAEQMRDQETGKIKETKTALMALEKQRDALKPDDPARKELEAKITEAQAKLKQSEEVQAQADKTAKELAEKVKTGNQMKQQLDQRLSDAKKNAQPKDLAVSFLSTPIKLRVHKAPIKLELPPSLGSVKAGGKIEITVPVVRMFNFKEAIEVGVNPPENVPGLSKVKGSLAADQTQVKIEFAPQKNAPAGEHPVVVKVKGKFGAVNFETEGQSTIKVEPAE